MAKFILIDQSIRKFGGHHFEYAVHVLKAAEKAGYEVALATNRDFHEAGGKWRVYPTYEYDFWGASMMLRDGQRRVKSGKKAVKGVLVRAKLKLGYSWLGLLLMARRNPDLVLRMFQGDKPSFSPWLLALLLPVAYMATVARAVVRWPRVLLRIMWSSFIGDLLRATWDILIALLFPLRMARQYGVRLVQWRWEQKRVAAFARDTRALLRKVALRQGDIVFIPTLSEIDLMGLKRCLLSDKSSQLASWHLLFRRNIYQGREPNYQQQEEQVQGLRAIFQDFCEAVPDHQVFFYTDTDELTRQWNRLHSASFVTLPIPVNEKFQSRPSGAADRPLCISYIGDARTEKGYQYIPSIVGELWGAYVLTGKAHFVLQSNFAFHTYEGQASIVMARQSLELLDKRGVTIIREPLNSEQYCDLVCQSDIGLLLYDPENYYARSSGALVEYLTAGVPVVVPAGSWLSTQIEAEVFAYQLAVIDGAENLGSYSINELNWRLMHQSEEAVAVIDGTLTIGGHGARGYVWLDVPEGATEVALSFKLSQITRRAQPGTYVHVHYEMLDVHGASVGKRAGTIGHSSSHSTHLTRIEPETRRIWLGLHNAYSDAPMTLTDLQVDFLRTSEGVPLSAVGVIVPTMDEAASALREIIDHYSHYRRSALAFSARWNMKHNPDALVHDLGSSRATTLGAQGVAQ